MVKGYDNEFVRVCFNKLNDLELSSDLRMEEGGGGGEKKGRREG